jgi:hypothetical protein
VDFCDEGVAAAASSPVKSDAVSQQTGLLSAWRRQAEAGRLRTLTWRQSWLVGAVVAAAGGLLYIDGLGRSYSYDESVTVANFVNTPSILDPLRRQVAFNNHPLLSLLDHAVFSVTGRHDEVVMRIVPLVAALAAVAVLTAVCTYRIGLLAGLAGGVVLASNPLFAQEAHTVRGYTLFLLCAIVTTAIVVDQEQQSWKAIVYTVAIVAGVATHTFMLPVVVFHAVYLAAARRLNVKWIVQIVVGTAMGLLLDIVVLLDDVANQHNRLFNPDLPSQLFTMVFRGQAAVALVPIAAVGLYQYRRRRDVLLTLLAAVVVISVLWLVVQPADLYDRFFFWLVPLAALGVAAGLRTIPLTAVVVAAVTVITLMTQLPDYGVSEYANREAASVMVRARAGGLRVCAVGDVSPIEGYTLDYVQAFPDYSNCDVAVVIPHLSPGAGEVVHGYLPHMTTYAAAYAPVDMYWRGAPLSP